MTLASQNLHNRADRALELVRETRLVLRELEIKIDNRSEAALPLVLASMDTAEAIYTLWTTKLEKYWVAALTMHRTQVDYVLRSAYFVKAASHKELMCFLKSGRMLKRGERWISTTDVAKDATQHLGWDVKKLINTVRNHNRFLSGLVHGGKEVLDIYTKNETLGDLTIDWDKLICYPTCNPRRCPPWP